MTEIIHNCSHLIGCCGEAHPNLITFLIGNDFINFLHWFKR